MTQKGRTSLAIAAAVLAAFTGWLGHIGYFGDQVYFEVPAAKSATALAPPHTVAVLFSGDMGFRVGMGPKIAARLAAEGVPVLGVSSLAEFRREHSPAEIRAFIAQAIRRGLAFAHADRAILIGQSFGADMLHVGATGLPDDLRRRIQTVALVVPGDSVIFRASPAELFNWAAPDAAALPTARQLTWVPVICIYGREESDSLCPHLDQANVKRVALPGGHPLHWDADALYAALRRQIVETAKAADITKSSRTGHLGESLLATQAAANPTGGSQ
ncbi:virulence factor [Novosphingobium sp. JCM 18896]|uniref:virulence factor n=1 Tax=Novosphingobium sp. JCM 18896 TaxID=2989731 RepID=UPI0022219EAF|nr:virulence factor [Novosphingobium sp. JCM 18896]MCW1430188.1 virulence factor [Novosphingobium sp. JCM 18896]